VKEMPRPHIFAHSLALNLNRSTTLLIPFHIASFAANTISHIQNTPEDTELRAALLKIEKLEQRNRILEEEKVAAEGRATYYKKEATDYEAQLVASKQHQQELEEALHAAVKAKNRAEVENVLFQVRADDSGMNQSSKRTHDSSE
jgi:hypothetical protein